MLLVNDDLKNVVKSVMVCCLVSKAVAVQEKSMGHITEMIENSLEINSTGQLTICLLLSIYLKKKKRFLKK